MVQFCPQCGTGDPDDGAVFCQKCGNRLPPRILERRGITCPACGMKNADPEAVYCNRCGSPLLAPPPAPARHVTVRVAAAPPVMQPKSCPSCGAPFVDAVSDYCNKCGANLHGPAPAAAAPEPPRPSPGGTGAPPVMAKERCPSCGTPLADEKSDYCNACGYRRRAAPPVPAGEPYQPPPGKTGAGRYAVPAETGQPSPQGTGPVPPVTIIPDDGGDELLPKKSRMPLLKWGLVAGAAVIILLITGAFITGMIPGMNRTANATAAAAVPDQESETTPVATTQAEEPAPSPEEEPEIPLPTMVVTTKAPATVTTKASTNVTTTTTANVTVNATAPPALPLADPSRPLPAGQSAYDGKGNLTVNDFSWKDKMSDPIPSYAIGKKYLIVNITYENLQQNGSVDADLSRMLLKDGGGYPFAPASDGLLEYPWTGTSIGPKEKRTGNLLFIVPPEATFLKLHYTFGDKGSAVFQLT